jgi:hypothetical protein
MYCVRCNWPLDPCIEQTLASAIPRDNMHGMDITTTQIDRIRDEGLGMFYEVNFTRSNGTVVVEFWSRPNKQGRLKKIIAIAPDGAVTRDTHI